MKHIPFKLVNCLVMTLMYKQTGKYSELNFEETER